jgi:regulator of sirC expression with transglutaminase-like and TPR domain
METAKQLKGDKEFPLVHRYLGGIYWKKKQYRMAADELETYVKLLPNAKDADQTRKTILELRSRQN